MKLFLTGACGRLGRAVVAEAADQGISVVGVDRVPWPEGEPKPQGLTLHIGSFDDSELIERLLPGCDAIINTAGMHGGDIATNDLGAFVQANVTGVARMLDQAMQFGVRSAVLSSTMEVVIGRDWYANGLGVVDEDTPARCDSIYSLSKYLMEELGKQYAKLYGISVASLRYMSFGYGDDRELGPFLLSRCVAARDVARACILAARRDDLQGEVFHIGPDSPLTNQDVHTGLINPEKVLEKHYPGSTEVLRNKNVELKTRCFWPVTSIRKAKLILGWQPGYTFEQWLLENDWKTRQPKTAATAAAR
jgi:nucleoside-diphosphate-sugar epimerase